MFMKVQKSGVDNPSSKKTGDGGSLTEYDALAEQLVLARSEVSALKLEVESVLFS